MIIKQGSIKLTDRKDHITYLTEPLVFYCKTRQTQLTIPIGFKTDLMSIKYRGLRLVYSRAGVGSNAAVIHDFRYSKEFDQSYPGLFISRDKADEEFYDMLIYSGMSKIKAKLAYYGVRIFGKKEYRK